MATQFNPFLTYSKSLQKLLVSAKNKSNPAIFLYENGARNILFMLEGLTRIHKDTFTNKKMEKWYNRFKKLEDLFGQIDYIHSFKKEFEKNKVLDVVSLKKMEQQIQDIAIILNASLTNKNWYNQKLLKFDAFIVDQKYTYDASYTNQISITYKKEIEKVIDFVKKQAYKIDVLETELHELRRKLRWLSIYALAFQGMFQLTKSQTNPTWSKKYMQKDIITSPYVQLPKPIKGIPIIALNYHSFIALSFIINKLGILKDSGLQSYILKTKLGFADIKIKTMLGKNLVAEKEIFNAANTLIATFFKVDNVLSNLLIQ
jgi:hypothetical protein